MSQNSDTTNVVSASVKAYSRYLLFIAGLGGLLYGVDVGIIAGALPFLQDTAKYLDAGKISQVVAAVLFGSVISSLFAGLLADIFGRKKIVIASALLFVLSIPVICLADSFMNLMLGRILQGISGGLIGVVVPLYLAECLGASTRGKGTGMFQFLLTVGLVFAAFIAIYFTKQVEFVQFSTGATTEMVYNAKDSAWRNIFWVSVIPGIMLFVGAFFVSESPRWLFRKGRKEEALIALRRGNSEEEALKTMAELEENAILDNTKDSAGKSVTNAGSIFQKKYVIPFVLAVVILACTQATGINSVLNYSVSIFRQGGLEGVVANYGDTALKVVNCLMTIVAVSLVDRKGRKFLLKLGTSGIILGLVGAATIFLGIENARVNVTKEVNTFISDSSINANLTSSEVLTTLELQGLDKDKLLNKQLIVSYEQSGDKHTQVVNFKPELIGGKEIIPVLSIAKAKPDKNNEISEIKILRADLGDRPDQTTGWLIVAFFIVFISSYAVGPGVCVWLALSELMPNRIRSNGMSIALLINQGVSTAIAACFLPWVGAWGYSGVFYTLACCTVVYFITAAFFLPETKGKTLEEIEEHFDSIGKKKKV